MKIKRIIRFILKLLVLPFFLVCAFGIMVITALFEFIQDDPDWERWKDINSEVIKDNIFHF